MFEKINKKLLPLVFLFSTVFTTYFIGPKSLNISAVILLLFVMLVVYLLDFIVNKKIKLSREGTNIPLFFLILWALFAVIGIVFWAVDIPNAILTSMYVYLGLFIYLILMNYVDKDLEIIKYCLYAFIIGIAINNIIAWYELLTFNYLFSLSKSHFEMYAANNYVLTFFANPNNLCTLLAFGFIISLGMADSSDNILFKLFCWLLSLSSFFIMIANRSESNAIGVIVALVVFLFFKILLKKGIGRKGKIASLILVIVFFIFFNTITSFVFQYIVKVITLLQNENSTLGVRILVAKNGIKGMFDYNLLGVGAGNSVYYSLLNGKPFSMHNWFVEILVDFGLPLFICYIALYIYQLFVFIKCYFKTKNKLLRNISLTYITILISFIFFNISPSSILTSEYVWIIWGLGFYMTHFITSKSLNIQE